uniref:DUF4838 domain-containing protein n=2 Tax=Flavobacterium sp. TaxID=239 RepID=UPI004049485A
MRELAPYFVCILMILGCQATSKDFLLYSIENDLPVVKIHNKNEIEFANDFCDLFEAATSKRLKIIETDISKNDVGIILKLVKQLSSAKTKTGFHIIQDKNTLLIEGTSPDQLQNGIRYFFIHYVKFYKLAEIYMYDNPLTEIVLKNNFSYAQANAFEYREPYFIHNFDKEFRKWNNTQTIDEIWGLWGHNLSKFVEHINLDMLSTVDGKKNYDQFCFSSKELEIALIEKLKLQKVDNPLVSKFMIMPNDNNLVCQCSQCIAAGNTKNNASPAVFSLLNKLSKKFSDYEFFSTAYITTQLPPDFQLEKNTGVMLSTMAFPKGVVYENSPKKDFIISTIDNWKKVSNKIYIWDYVINFDNYLGSYPTVLTTQKNLQLFHKMGVKGVFLHGNEDAYAAFSDMKAFLYAQLLQNPNVDVKELLNFYLQKRFPSKWESIAKYYMSIEQKAMASPKQLDIYGGWNQSLNKYLDYDELDSLHNELMSYINEFGVYEMNSINPLLTALHYQKLEMMRLKGVGKNGFASTTMEKPEDGIVKEEVSRMVGELKRFANISKITVINESQQTIADYLKLWDSQILNKIHKNYLFGREIEVLSELDEDYTKVSMLNDGAVGFYDYFNNWMLNTVDELEIKVKTEDVLLATSVDINFLNIPRHRIYLPEAVEVKIGERVYTTKIEPANYDTEASKRYVNVPITVKNTDEFVTVKIIKQAEFKDKSTACDEIYFN